MATKPTKTISIPAPTGKRPTSVTVKVTPAAPAKSAAKPAAKPGKPAKKSK